MPGRLDKRYHPNRDLARAADAARSVEVSGPGGYSFGSHGSQFDLRALTAVRLFEITEAWTQEARAKPWPTGSWYAIAKPVLFYPDNLSSSGDWLLGVQTPEFAIWCPDNTMPSSAVGDQVWAVHNPQSGFWELLTASAAADTVRWGALDGDLLPGSSQIVSLYQTSGGGDEGWDVDSSEDISALAPPTLPIGATVPSDGSRMCQVRNTGTRWVVMDWEPIIRDVEIEDRVDTVNKKLQMRLLSIGIPFSTSSGDWVDVHQGIVCSSSSGS